MTLEHLTQNTLLGYTRDGEAVRISVSLRATTQPQTHWETGAPIAAGALEVSFQGTVGSEMRGQIREALNDISKPARRFPRAKIDRIEELWADYHLNAMQSACAHQKNSDGYAAWIANTGRMDLDTVPACDTCGGYRFGSAWLHKPVPAKIVDELRSLFA